MNMGCLIILVFGRVMRAFILVVGITLEIKLLIIYVLGAKIILGYGTIFETAVRFVTKTEIYVAITGLFTCIIAQTGQLLILVI